MSGTSKQGELPAAGLPALVAPSACGNRRQAEHPIANDGWRMGSCSAVQTEAKEANHEKHRRTQMLVAPLGM